MTQLVNIFTILILGRVHHQTSNLDLEQTFD